MHNCILGCALNLLWLLWFLGFIFFKKNKKPKNCILKVNNFFCLVLKKNHVNETFVCQHKVLNLIYAENVYSWFHFNLKYHQSLLPSQLGTLLCIASRLVYAKCRHTAHINSNFLVFLSLTHCNSVFWRSSLRDLFFSAIGAYCGYYMPYWFL